MCSTHTVTQLLGLDQYNIEVRKDLLSIFNTYITVDIYFIHIDFFLALYLSPSVTLYCVCIRMRMQEVGLGLTRAFILVFLSGHIFQCQNLSQLQEWKRALSPQTLDSRESAISIHQTFGVDQKPAEFKKINSFQGGQWIHQLTFTSHVYNYGLDAQPQDNKKHFPAAQLVQHSV